MLVRQFLRRAEVIALVPSQAVDGWRGRRQPQRVFVLPVVVAILGLVEQFDGVVGVVDLQAMVFVVGEVAFLAVVPALREVAACGLPGRPFGFMGQHLLAQAPYGVLLQVAAALGEPADAMAVRAHGGDALVQCVVFVLPHAHQRLAQAGVVLARKRSGLGMTTTPATRFRHCRHWGKSLCGSLRVTRVRPHRKLIRQYVPRERTVPVTTAEQRHVLGQAQQLAGAGSLILAHKNFIQQHHTYGGQCKAAGLSHMHGLRHRYAQASL